MLVYPVESSGEVIVLVDSVVEHVTKFTHHDLQAKEAGGQLFAELEENRIVVAEATGPRATDFCGRNSYRPDRSAERKEIKSYHRRGLHFVGDWHTHPEPVPTPSDTDVTSINECYSRSIHSLGAFVLLIVGTEDPPLGFWLSLHNETVGLRLSSSCSIE